MESMSPPFTLTIDWMAFTLPKSSVEAVSQALGCEWVQGEGGFRGYPRCWIYAGSPGGVGKLGTQAPRKPQEVHVDLSAGIVSTWPFEKVQIVLAWIFEQTGHLTRIDYALDDRQALVSLEQIKQAIDAGHCLTRAEVFTRVHGGKIHTGISTGETLYLGSPASQTMLRIYDKRLELQQKNRANWQDYGIRWEMQLKKERAQAFGIVLRTLPLDEGRRYAVGVLRAFVNFRETTRDAPDWVRYRATPLPWWNLLTEGLERCQLDVEFPRQSLEDIKHWVSRSLAPTLAVLCVAPGAGQVWLEQAIQAGADRWKAKHYQLLKRTPPNRTYRLGQTPADTRAHLGGSRGGSQMPPSD